jgi:hypothetical protein
MKWKISFWKARHSSNHREDNPCIVLLTNYLIKQQKAPKSFRDEEERSNPSTMNAQRGLKISKAFYWTLMATESLRNQVSDFVRTSYALRSRRMHLETLQTGRKVFCLGKVSSNRTSHALQPPLSSSSHAKLNLNSNDSLRY